MCRSTLISSSLHEKDSSPDAARWTKILEMEQFLIFGNCLSRWLSRTPLMKALCETTRTRGASPEGEETASASRLSRAEWKNKALRCFSSSVDSEPSTTSELLIPSRFATSSLASSIVISTLRHSLGPNRRSLSKCVLTCRGTGGTKDSRRRMPHVSTALSRSDENTE